ncbi:hypothetical protein BS78_02G275000 [Paspalum vaginatum]|nr:hypothetical protein BS78_02G275000 [Paspalum vaginatum]
MARTTPWTGYLTYLTFSGLLRMNTSSVLISLEIVNTEDEIYLTYRLSDGGAPQTRFVLTYSGDYQLQSWGSSDWSVLGRWPANDECDLYGRCGPNGYCDGTAAVRTCECLDGFEPTSLEDRSRRKEALLCDGSDRRQRQFRGLAGGVKTPDKFMLVENRTSEECAMECGKNCSCVAYAYANLSSSSRYGTRCLVWAQKLFGTEKVGDSVGTWQGHAVPPDCSLGCWNNYAKDQSCKDCAPCGSAKWHSDTHRHFPCMVQVQKGTNEMGKHKTSVLGNHQNTFEYPGEGNPTGGFEWSSCKTRRYHSCDK